VKAGILCFQGFPGFQKAAFPKILHRFACIALFFDRISGLKKLNMEKYRSGHNELDSKSTRFATPQRAANPHESKVFRKPDFINLRRTLTVCSQFSKTAFSRLCG